jgi:hypothetical protein
MYKKSSLSTSSEIARCVSIENSGLEKFGF